MEGCAVLRAVGRSLGLQELRQPPGRTAHHERITDLVKLGGWNQLVNGLPGQRDNPPTELGLARHATHDVPNLR